MANTYMVKRKREKVNLTTSSKILVLEEACWIISGNSQLYNWKVEAENRNRIAHSAQHTPY